MELREQRRIDAFAGLVAGPLVIAERFDHVVGGDAQVRRACLEHREHGVEHSGRGTHRLVPAGGAAQPEEVAEQLVRAIDQVNDHAAPMVVGRGADVQSERPSAADDGPDYRFTSLARLRSSCSRSSGVMSPPKSSISAI
jgi:hypothetical protein